MANYTHRLSSDDWDNSFLVDENQPQLAVSEKNGDVFSTFNNWLELYREGGKVKVERLHVNLENK